MPARIYDLQIDQGRSFYPIWVWITGGQGYNPAGTTSVAVFRQIPSDSPVLTVTTTPNANGSALVYLPAVPNFPYIPPNTDPNDPTVTPSLITIYPMQLLLYPADTALLAFQFYRWKWDILVTGTSIITPWLAGSVEVMSV